MKKIDTMHELGKIEKKTIELFVVCLKAGYLCHLAKIFLDTLLEIFVPF